MNGAGITARGSLASGVHRGVTRSGRSVPGVWGGWGSGLQGGVLASRGEVCETRAGGQLRHFRKGGREEMEENGTAQSAHTCQTRAISWVGAVSPKRLCLLGHLMNFTSHHGQRDL